MKNSNFYGNEQITNQLVLGKTQNLQWYSSSLHN